MKKWILSCILFFTGIVLSFSQGFPVKEALQPYISRGDIAGVVTMIATKDKVLQTDALGYSNLETQTPMNAGSFFWIASQSKPIAAVAVMILVDEGKLALNDPAIQYLPELSQLRVIAEQDDKHTLLVPPDKPITIEHLLSHSSGMIWVPPLQQKFGIDMLPFSQALTTCLMTPLASQPGTKYSYSNMGVNIAATIVERVSGMVYEDFLKRRVFDPLGMKETTFWPSPEQQKRLALVYRMDKKSGKLVPAKIGQLNYPLDNKDIRFPEAAGGLFSTPNELVRFYQMLANGGKYGNVRILSEQAVQEIQKQHPADLDSHYGLCVGISDGVFGHSGACGTDSKINTKNGRVMLYFIQEEGLPQASEVRDTFFKIASQ
jgi:CubicO group peptidase (beta-lactamase class C family)